MNPLMLLAGLQNPDAFASAMASMGIDPGTALGITPGADGAFPSMPAPSAGLSPAGVGGASPATQGVAGGGLPMPGDMSALAGQWLMPAPTALGAGYPATPAGQSPAGVSGFQGAKMPTAPGPIMSGGVSGSQGAPTGGGGIGAGGSAVADALLALISGRGQVDPLRVPQLGALLARGA